MEADGVKGGSGHAEEEPKDEDMLLRKEKHGIENPGKRGLCSSNRCRFPCLQGDRSHEFQDDDALEFSRKVTQGMSPIDEMVSTGCVDCAQCF